MTRIAALNDWSVGSSEEEDVGPTREALEAQATKSYNEAINFLAHGNIEEAHKHFCQVLQNSYVEKACWPEGVEPGGTLPQDLALKYSCFKNLGNLATKQGDHDKAVKHYLEAVQLDGSEVTLWQRLGAAAIKIKDFELSLVAFQEGLNVNPNHWPCMDQLLSILFILEMYMDCLGLAISALTRDPGYVKANAFKDKIFELQPSLMQDVKSFFRDSSILFQEVNYDKSQGEKFVATCEALRPPCKAPHPPSPFMPQKLKEPLPKLTWENLAQALILTYDALVDADGMEFAAKIDIHEALKPKEDKEGATEENKKSEVNEGVGKETERQQQDDKGEMRSRENKDEPTKATEEGEGNKTGKDERNSSDECKTSETPTNEERLEASVADLSENSLTPRRIAGRRHTIELGESQDSFRVGEKRRSMDSDTLPPPDEDTKGEESATNRPAEGEPSEVLASSSDQAKDMDIKEPDGPCKESQDTAKEPKSPENKSVCKLPDVNKEKECEGTAQMAELSSGHNMDKAPEEQVSSKEDMESSAASQDKKSSEHKQLLLPRTEEKTEDSNKAQGEQANTTSQIVGDHSKKEEKVGSRGESPIPGAIKEVPSGNKQDDNQQAQNIDRHEDQSDMAKESSCGGLEDSAHPDKDKNKCPNSGQESELPAEKSAEKPTYQPGNTEDEGDTSTKMKEKSAASREYERITEEIARAGDIFDIQPEKVRFCELPGQGNCEQEATEQDKHNTSEIEEEELEEEEGEEEVEAGDDGGIGEETEMIQEEEEGMEEDVEEEEEEGEPVTETEAAVNALKDIMALQPTEILGLPETHDFDYDSEYVEYFEGGVYEEDEELENEEDMDQEGMEREALEEGIIRAAAEQEGIMERMSLAEVEQMEQEGTDGMEQEGDIEQEGAEQGDGLEQDGTEVLEGTEAEGIDMDEATDNLEQAEQDLGDLGDLRAEDRVEQGEGGEQEDYDQEEIEGNAMEEDLEEHERDGPEEEGEAEEEEEEREQGQGEESPRPTPEKPEENEKRNEEEPESSVRRQNRHSTEDDTNQLESDTGLEESEANSKAESENKAKEPQEDKTQDAGEAVGVNNKPPSQTATSTEKPSTVVAPGAGKKPKRHKRGLERELEQLDYWGRRQERDAKRRRRTISSKLLGAIEEAEYLTWADLLRSFAPSTLLTPNAEERNKLQTLQQIPPQGKVVQKAGVPPAASGVANPSLPQTAQGGETGQTGEDGGKPCKEGEEATHKSPSESILQKSPTTTKPAAGDVQEEMEVDQEPKEERPEDAEDKEAKGNEKENTETEIRKQRKEVILSSTSTEEEQVEAFLLCYEENGGILHLLQLCLHTLYKRHLRNWPISAAKIFTAIYPRVRNHVPHRPPLSLKEDWEGLYEDSMISLTHWELVVSLYQASKQHTPLSVECEHLEDDFVHLTLMLGRGDVWVEETPQFHTRLRWLQAQINLCQDQPEEAVRYLELLLSDLDRLADPEKDFVVEGARVQTDLTVVSNAEVRRHLNFLQRSHMLEQVVDNYTCHRYQMVTDLLTSIFHEPPPKARPGVTLPTRQTQLVILIDSLLKLKDYKGVLSWGTPSLTEALKRFNRAEAEEEKNRWAKTLMIITDSMNTTLEKDITYMDNVEGEKLVELVNTLIQMLVVQLEKPQSAQVLPFETLTPWILLHRMLTHEEQLQKQAEKNKVETQLDAGKKQETPGSECDKEAQNPPQAEEVSGPPGGKASDMASDNKPEDKEALDEDTPSNSKASEVPYPSTLFLITAHDELGKHSWCCYDDGVFLLYCLDQLLVELQRPLDAQHRQLLHHTLEQISFCLYSHPSKKSKHKHLRDHGVPQIALCWDRALQLYQYYCPAQLPDFQSSQIPSITDDVASFLKRILALFPADARPENKVTAVDAFINGEEKECNYTPVGSPTEEIRDGLYLLGDYYFKNKEWNNAIKYYKLDLVMNPERLESWAPLGLAMKAIMETQLNSCEVIKDEEEFFSMAQRATRCCSQALKLDEYHTNLWVEFGGLVYMVHSHASRLLKQDLNPDISIETFEMLEKLKVDMLNQAEHCFTQALKIQEEGWDDDSLPDERWLHCYMLGKVAEKQGNSPEIILKYYIKASQHLHQIQAKYPSKINYNSPQEYSVEALEMYYRVHAYILKYLQLKEGKGVDKEVLTLFTKILDDMTNGPFASCQEKKRASPDITKAPSGVGDNAINTTSNPVCEEGNKDLSPQKRQLEESGNEYDSPSKKTRNDKDSEDLENIVKDVVHEIISDAVVKSGQQEENETITKGAERNDDKNASAESKATEGKEQKSTEKDKRESDDEIQVVEEKVVEKNDHIAIIQRCISALKLCLSRFPQNYKALYRLAYYNNTSKFHKDCSRARNYLLGCDFWQRVGYMPVNGLFNERKVWIQQPKNCNFFHGVWRIPNDEVDRPGSFAAHMYRCVSLILDILPQLKDFYTVLQIALALKNSPEKDKKYLRDNERELLSEHATQVGLQAMKDKYKLLFNGSSPAHTNRRMTFLLDVYRSYKQISRHLPGSEPHLAKMVTETYASLRGIEPDSRANILREADAFCNRNQHLQHRLPSVVSSEGQMGMGGAPVVSRRGRPPGSGRGRGRGRGSLYSPQQNPNMIAIQEAYKMYENVVNTRAILNNQNLDRAALFTHQKELEYYQNELSKYMSIPSVTQYFRSTLESVGITAKSKLPPPQVKAPTTSTASSAAPGNRMNLSTAQMSPMSHSGGTQQMRHNQAKPGLTSLTQRSQIHGISITSVTSPKTVSTTASNPIKPNMSVTVSPVKAPCPPALQGRGEISVISVSRPSTASKTTTATITTARPATSRTDSPTSAVKTIVTTASPKPAVISTESSISRTISSSLGGSTVPKLPAGTTIIRPRDSPGKSSGPRPQLQAQARPAKSQAPEPTLDSLSSPMRKVAAEIIPTTGTTTTRPSSVTKPAATGQGSKPSLPKGMTITPAPRIKTKAHLLPSRATTSASSPSTSTFSGGYSTPLSVGESKGGRASGVSTTASVSATVIGPEERRSITTTSQSNKSMHVAQLSPSQLMQLAYGGRERAGNISGLLNQYSKTSPARPARPQAPAAPRPQASAAPRQQVPPPQRFPAPQRPQASGSQRGQPVRPVQTKPPPPKPPTQTKPDQGQRRSSDDIIILD